MMHPPNEVRCFAPGRINIIGEHTDYNDGFVMPAPINLGTTSHLSINSTPSTCKVTSQSLKKSFSFSLNQIKPSSSTWENYILGVVNEFQRGGHKLSGFDLSITSTLPMGAGLSSSAALICSFAWSINLLFNLNLSRKDIALLCQSAEHTFVGIKSGIMDQFTSMMGRKDHVMLLDCRSLDCEFIPMVLKEYTVVLINTNVKHTLAKTAYNDRVNECRAGVKALRSSFSHIDSLRDASLRDLETVQPKLSDMVFNRCQHVIEENLRVTSARYALYDGYLSEIGSLMNQSHESLKGLYEVSCPELDLLVDLAQRHDSVIGSRMMGGGFGGCTINLVRRDADGLWLDEVASKYFSRFGQKPSVINVSSSGACNILDY